MSSAATDPPNPVHRRLVLKETLSSIFVNALVAALVVWLFFAEAKHIPVLGTSGGAFGVVPGTFLFTFAMTIGLTLAIRKRVRRAIVPGIALARAPAVARRLPQNLPLRALTLATTAWLCLVPVTFALLYWLAPPTWSRASVFAFNALYFSAMCVPLIPIIAWRALCDVPRQQR